MPAAVVLLAVLFAVAVQPDTKQLAKTATPLSWFADAAQPLIFELAPA